jgi:guanine nucleotide-binding protein subunit gamma
MTTTTFIVESATHPETSASPTLRLAMSAVRPQQLVVQITTEPAGHEESQVTPSKRGRRVPQIAVRRQQLFGSAAPVSSLAKYAVLKRSEDLAAAESQNGGSPDKSKIGPLHYPLGVAKVDADQHDILQLRLKTLERQVASLQDELDRPRLNTSEACDSLIKYMMSTRDTMVPSVWGKAPAEEREFMGPQSSVGCCSIS